MKLSKYVLGLSILATMVSCGQKLTTDDANALTSVAPSVVDASIQRIGGVAADLNSTPINLEPLTKLSTVFARAFAPEVANILAKNNASNLLTSSLKASLQNLRSGRVETMQARAGSSCGQDANQADADSDGIPDSIVNYAYDCLSNGVQTTGTITVKDNYTTGNGDGPYEVHIKKLKVLDVNPQSSDFNVSITLDLDLDLKSTTAPYAVSEGISITLKPDDTKSDFVTVGFSSSLKYTPDSTSNPFNGQGAIDSSSSFNFAYNVKDNAGKTFQANKTFKLTANVHRNKPACASGGDVEMDSGSIQFSDDVGNYVRTTSVSCNSSSWTWETNVK
jgi:hypothetical protein